MEDDRGNRLPDDVEGHSWRSPSQDTESTEEDLAEDDTKGHWVRVNHDTNAVDENQAGDDTEGHIMY